VLKIGVCGVLAAIGMMAAGGYTFAANVPIDCSGTPGALATEFNTTHPGGLSGTTYVITGTCTGSITITQNNIIIQAASGTQEINTTGGSANPTVTILNADHILLLDLDIVGPNTASPATVSIRGPADVRIQSSTIENDGTHGAQGVSCVGPAHVLLVSSKIQKIGSNSGFDGPPAGVLATGSCFVQVTGTTIQNNGGTALSVSSGATVQAFAGGSITVPNTAPAVSAVVVAGQSHVALDGVTVTGPSPGTNYTIAALQGASVFLHGSTISGDILPVTPAIPFAVIAAAGSSSIVLAGGNTISNTAPIPLSCTGTTIASCPVAILVADGSSLIQSNGALFGQMPAVDTITGKGSIQTQSAIELAISPETGVGLGGITWNGNIGVAQSSTFRADGDNVMINGTLILGQAANAIFNKATGTTIDITSVVCQSTTDHVAGGTAVTPNVMMGVPPACEPF